MKSIDSAAAPAPPETQVIGVYKGKEFQLCWELDSVTHIKSAEL